MGENMGVETAKDEQPGDSSVNETPTDQAQEPAPDAPESGAVVRPRASPARRGRAASPTRKTTMKPAAAIPRKAAVKKVEPGKKTVAKKSSGGARGKSKTPSGRKSAAAGGTSKMLKNIATRLDLSRRQLTAALDDLAALVGRQIGTATAPLPRLVKGEWKTMEALGKQLAGKLGIAGKGRSSNRRVASKKTTSKKTTSKAPGTGSKASVAISVKKRPSRSRRST